MKLINILEKEILLELETTDKTIQEVYLPKENIHYWYPFNVNFFYRYSTAKDYMYLVMDKHYEGENIYNTTILKRTKRLMKHDGVPLHLEVYERNSYVMDKAFELGIPTIAQDYKMEDVRKGFDKVCIAIDDLRSMIEARYIDEKGGTPPLTSTESWDRALYSVATEEELRQLQLYGEIYTMLRVMRKLSE